MCGRFSLSVNQEIIEKYFGLEHDAETTIQSRYNIAPTQQIPIIPLENPSRLKVARWGLVPHWAKDASIGDQLINARKETIDEKPSFRESFNTRRCLIPADGFYEWKKVGNSKLPFRIERKDKAVFALAGLYDYWRSEHKDMVITCTIITLEANALVAKIHPRMPAMLLPDQQHAWMQKRNTPQELLEVLKPYPADLLKAYPISSLINDPSTDTAEVARPVPTL
jgi:putative SOS response-associated peptidase YedK